MSKVRPSIYLLISIIILISLAFILVSITTYVRDALHFSERQRPEKVQSVVKEFIVNPDQRPADKEDQWYLYTGEEIERSGKLLRQVNIGEIRRGEPLIKKICKIIYVDAFRSC